MQYLTDGVYLYEIADRRTVVNSGCFWRSGGRYGSAIQYVIIRDCVSGATATLDELDLAALSTVRQ